MKKNVFLLVSCLFLSLSLWAAAPTVSERVVGGYVAYYSPLAPLPNPNLHTHLFYSCAEPLMNADGTFNKIKILNQKYYSSEPDLKRFKAVLALKQQNPNLKVLLSFGNSSVNGGFSALCKSATARKAFADSCLALCNRYGLDGIDLDWEFPGMSYSSSFAYDEQHDVDNFTLLMQQLSAILHPQGKLLTFAGSISNVSISGNTKKYIDFIAIEPYVDWVNMMVYDLMSAPYPHNPLYYPPHTAWSCDGAVMTYINAGFPANKIALGLPFYGRHTYESGVEDAGEVYYKNILTGIANGKYEDHWNDTWKVPYITKVGATAVWASYDNPRSIKIKGDYAIAKGLLGLMYWEITGDQGTTLQQALWDAIKTDTTVVSCNPYGWTTAEQMYQALAADVIAAKNGGMTNFLLRSEFETSGTFGAPNVNTDVSGINYDIQYFDSAFFITEPYKSKWEWMVTYINNCCVRDSKTAPATAGDNWSNAIRHNLAAFFANSQRTDWLQSADYTSCGAASTAYESTWGYSLTCDPSDWQPVENDVYEQDGIWGGMNTGKATKFLYRGKLYIRIQDCVYDTHGRLVME